MSQATARQGLRGTLSPSRNLSVLSTSAARLPMISLRFFQSRSQQILNPHCQAHGLKYRELTGLLPLGLSSWQSVWLPLPLWPTGFRSFLLRQTELEVRREPSGRTPLRLSHPQTCPAVCARSSLNSRSLPSPREALLLRGVRQRRACLLGRSIRIRQSDLLAALRERGPHR